MQDTKSIILVIVIVVLIGSAGVLTYMISNGQDPLVLLNTRATDEEEFTNSNLLADSGDEGKLSPSPTISFTSTSPTIGPSNGPNATMTPTKSPTPEPSVTSLPDTGGGTTVTPTPVETLPVAGPANLINPAIISGGILILLAMIL